MKLLQKFRWSLVILIVVLVAVCAAILISCNKNSNSPTSPSGDYCQGATTCPGGGWIKACAKSNGCAYYLASDGTRFNCDSCNVCDWAAQRAVDYCFNQL